MSFSCIKKNILNNKRQKSTNNEFYLVYGIIRLIFETSYTKFVSYTDVMFVLSLIGLIFYMYL